MVGRGSNALFRASGGFLELGDDLLAFSVSGCQGVLIHGHVLSRDLLAGRRGPLGTLAASAANLDTPLPQIDLVNESLEAGEHSRVWNGRGDSGERAASGVYFARMITDNDVVSTKLMLVK